MLALRSQVLDFPCIFICGLQLQNWGEGGSSLWVCYIIAAKLGG